MTLPSDLSNGEENGLKPVICGVIVCYHPDLCRLSSLVKTLEWSECVVILVDNTENGVGLAGLSSGICHIILNKTNLGIARAQNIGVEKAQSLGAQIVVFFDQDSEIDAGFIATLIQPLKVGQAGISAPVSIEKESKLEYPSLLVNSRGFVRKKYSAGMKNPYKVDVVIASGTAATIECFSLAGGMDEKLFIDFVDTEWCLRCRKRHIPIHVVPSAIMYHSIGSGSHTIGGLTLIKHSPIRCYYQVRNSFLLFRNDCIPFLFALRESVTVVLSRFLLALYFSSSRRHHFKQVLRGLWDGALGVSGPQSPRLRWK